MHYRTSNNLLRRRTYTVNSDVRWMHKFQPIVSRAYHSSHGGKPRVRWASFHDTLPVGPAGGEEGARADAQKHSRDVNGLAGELQARLRDAGGAQVSGECWL